MMRIDVTRIARLGGPPPGAARRILRGRRVLGPGAGRQERRPGAEARRWRSRWRSTSPRRRRPSRENPPRPPKARGRAIRRRRTRGVEAHLETVEHFTVVLHTLEARSEEPPFIPPS